MARLSTLTEDSLSDQSLATLESFRLKGKLAPVYLEIANSEHALHVYLAMENALKASSLSLQEIEAIKLLGSELNQCNYCLSVHHFKAGAAGFDTQQIICIRRGEPIGIKRVDAIVSTVMLFFRSPGALSDEQVEHLRDAGFEDAELVDITLALATIFFTNTFNHINHTESTLPAAPSPLASSSAAP